MKIEDKFKMLEFINTISDHYTDVKSSNLYIEFKNIGIDIVPFIIDRINIDESNNSHQVIMYSMLLTDIVGCDEILKVYGCVNIKEYWNSWYISKIRDERINDLLN